MTDAQTRPDGSCSPVRYASVYYMRPIPMRSSTKGSVSVQLMVMTAPDMAERTGR
jgi:hypothetical protein